MTDDNQPYQPEFVAEVFGCERVSYDGQYIWIEGGATAGRWLGPEDYVTLAKRARLKREAAAVHTPPPQPERPKAQRKSTVRVETITPYQRHEAGLTAFTILISGNVETPAQAMAMALNMIKLRDKVRLNVKRHALLMEKDTVSLRRRLRTLRTHIEGIIGNIVELNGTRQLQFNIGDNGAVSLVYGNNSLLLG